MIFNLLINFVLLIVGSIFVFLPEVSLAGLPIVGDFLPALLLRIVVTWNAFVETFPYAGLAWSIVLYVILPFEALLIISKFFLGSRSPGQTH